MGWPAPQARNETSQARLEILFWKSKIKNTVRKSSSSHFFFTFPYLLKLLKRSKNAGDGLTRIAKSKSYTSSGSRRMFAGIDHGAQFGVTMVCTTSRCVSTLTRARSTKQCNGTLLLEHRARLCASRKWFGRVHFLRRGGVGDVAHVVLPSYGSDTSKYTSDKGGRALIVARDIFSE